jgi:hypothetical protein
MANPYHVQLLNDLHHHFPELLYNHQRFESIGEVLGYMNDVVRTNRQHQAYHYYHQEYNARFHQRHMNELYNNDIFMNDQLIPPPVSQRIPSPILERSIARRVYEDHIGSLPDLIPAAAANPRVQIQTHYIGLGSNLSSLVEQLFQDMIPRNLGDLEDVPIIPTDEHLRNNTTVRCLEADVGDNCAICQDPMNATQNIRTITHCEHMFHIQCIDTWFQRNIHCPCCRHDIREP